MKLGKCGLMNWWVPYNATPTAKLNAQFNNSNSNYVDVSELGQCFRNLATADLPIHDMNQMHDQNIAEWTKPDFCS